ncbi:hypothetical protein Vadar_020472 [Vaccinium darrowii]|uniref:Uncharacterized protein n=1 Tax=Vaccinium darrowii TaxID=229202 RepID=A0ACB7ZCN2_9ERIC|nr:hypothetical protein Vadar_020472 [Vaccinium darrowii]
MELGLSLGGDSTTATASRPFGFLAKNPDNNNIKSTAINRGLEFRMALGINSDGKRILQDQDRDKSSADGDDESEAVKRSKSTRNSHRNRTASVDPPLQLALSWPSDNGSSEGGSSGKVRGFDVNRLPAAAAEAEAEDGAAVSSSPNSVASSFQVDFGVFRGGNKLDLEAVAAGNDGGEAERASSRASDDDENSSRKKLRLSKEQSAYLEESFKEHNTLNPKQKLALAKQLNLRPRQVEVWFQNRRARTKLKQTEVDCEYLKRCCETLTEENRRLHKELQELRALKNSNPFFMQLPATTLTMCPSCERVATTTTTSTAVATTTNSNVPNSSTTAATDSTSKAANPFPLSRPRFYPFSQSQPPPHQSAAS